MKSKEGEGGEGAYEGGIRISSPEGNFHANEGELFSGWPHLFMMHPSFSRHLNFYTVPLKLNDFKTIRACRNFLHMLCHATP